MLTLAITLLVALYLIAPELLSRSIIGSRRPVKVIPRTHSEELFHGIIWALLPLALALVFSVGVHGWRWPQASGVVAKVFEDLYSEKLFDNDRLFYPAVEAFIVYNLWLLLPLYSIVILLSVLLVENEAGRIPRWLRWLDPLLSLLAGFMLPSIPELYLLLAADHIPGRLDVEKHVDVLTKAGALYRGRVGTLAFNADGTLQLLLLQSPRRFRSADYQESKKTSPNLATAGFWDDIPGNSFVLVGSEISNLNLRFVPKNPVLNQLSGMQKEVLERVSRDVRAGRATSAGAAQAPRNDVPDI